MKTEKIISINNNIIKSNIIYKEIGPLEVMGGQKIIIEDDYFVICCIDGKEYDWFRRAGTYEIDEKGKTLILKVFRTPSVTLDCTFGMLLESKGMQLAPTFSFKLVDYDKFKQSKFGNYQLVFSKTDCNTKENLKNQKISYIELRDHIQRDLKNEIEALIDINNPIKSLKSILETDLDKHGLQLLELE